MAKILTENQYKLNKGNALQYATAGISLSPATEAIDSTSKIRTLCQYAASCVRGCISITGKNGLSTAVSARQRRTRLYLEQTGEFFAQVTEEIRKWSAKETRKGNALAFRPNILSDQPMLAKRIAELFPAIQVYDYTKLPKPGVRRLPNYHLTYSYSERSTAADIRHCVDNRINIAVIFDTNRGESLPVSVTLHGVDLSVIDGDETDLRFLDPSDKTYVVGLRWKRGKNSRENLKAAIEAGLVISARWGGPR